MPPRRRKKKIAAAEPSTPASSRVLAVPELVGRVYDYLDVEKILSITALCKSLNAATAFVTHLNRAYDSGTKMVALVWLRFQQAQAIELDGVVTEETLSKLSSTVSLAGRSWRRLVLDLSDANSHDDDDDDDDDDSRYTKFSNFLRSLHLAIGRGALPSLEYFSLRVQVDGEYVYPDKDDPLYPELKALAHALPPFAGACLALRYFDPEELETILDAHPELDLCTRSPTQFTRTSLLREWARTDFTFEEDEIACFRALVSRGADPNQLVHGWNMCSICEKSRQLQLLLDEGADINKGRVKPLLFACGAGLSRKNYDPEDLEGWDRVNVDLCYSPCSDEVDIMLAAGADPLIVDSGGKGVLEILGDRLGDAHHALTQNPECQQIRTDIEELGKITVAVGRAIEKIAREKKN